MARLQLPPVANARLAHRELSRLEPSLEQRGRILASGVAVGALRERPDGAASVPVETKDPVVCGGSIGSETCVGKHALREDGVERRWGVERW